MRKVIIIVLTLGAVGTLAVPRKTMVWYLYENQTSLVVLWTVRRTVTIIATNNAALGAGTGNPWRGYLKQMLEATPSLTASIQHWPYTRFPGYFSVGAPCWALSLLFAAYPATALIHGPLRHWRRRRKGLCLKCAYDLTGNVSGVCPEGGIEIKVP